MTVLVTGATGSLGQTLVARLLAEGHPVAVLTRRPFRAAALFGETVAIHEWHPMSEPVPIEALQAVDGIVHLMGEPFAGRPGHDRARLVLQSRVGPTRSLVEAVTASGGRPRLVVASLARAPAGEGEALDDRTLPAPAAGEAPPDDDAPWEMEAFTASAGGASVAVVRLGLVGAETPLLAALAGLARQGLLLDMRGAQIPSIDAADAAAMLSGLVQRRDLTGILHGVAPEPIGGEALMAALARLSRLPMSLPLPAWMLKEQLGRIGPLLKGRRPLYPGRLVEAGAMFTERNPMASIGRALDALAMAAPRRQPLSQLLRRSRPAEPA